MTLKRLLAIGCAIGLLLLIGELAALLWLARLAHADTLQPDCQAMPWLRLETQSLGDYQAPAEQEVRRLFPDADCTGGCTVETYWCAWEIPACEQPLPCTTLDFCEEPVEPQDCVRRCIDCRSPSLTSILACNLTRGCRVQDLMRECEVTGVDLQRGCPGAGSWYGTLIVRVNNLEVLRVDLDAFRVWRLAGRIVEMLREESK